MYCVPFSKMRIQTKLMNIVSTALKKGKWIVLHDFHLLKDAFDDVVYLLNKISTADDVHSQFKLWIVTYPAEEFPVTILLKGIKITIKENKYLGPMLHQLYTFSSIRMPQLFENQKSNRRWNFHFFFVCFCHAVLKTIQNHGHFFLDAYCDFTKMNFRSSSSFLEIFSTDNEGTFINDYKYLLAECSYGANFSESADHIMLSAIVESLDVERSDSPSFIEILGIRFGIPRDMSFNACIRYIQSLPKTSMLKESNFYHFLALERIQTTTDFWKLIRKLYCCGTLEDENMLSLMIDDMLVALNSIHQFGNFVGSLKDVFNVYLSQEIAVYTTLIQFIVASLERLKHRINILSTAMETTEISAKLRNNEIPTCWSPRSYPFTNSLKIYIENLNQRLVFINKWIHYGPPEIIWLPGLFNARGFFTTLKYNFSQHRDVSLSDVSLRAEVTHFDLVSATPEEWHIFYGERKNHNPFGVFINGLKLIGGYWNREKLTIDDPTYDNHFDTLPVVWIAPELCRKYEATESIYCCPLYYTHPTRDQRLQFRFPNYITHVDLATSVPITKIAQRGVRLILYLD